MRIVFIGKVAFSKVILSKIIDSNIEMHKIQYDQSVTIQAKEQLYSITQV